MFALSFRDNKDNIGQVRDWINMIESENLDLKENCGINIYNKHKILNLSFYHNLNKLFGIHFY